MNWDSLLSEKYVESDKKETQGRIAYAVESGCIDAMGGNGTCA